MNQNVYIVKYMRHFLMNNIYLTIENQAIISRELHYGKYNIIFLCGSKYFSNVLVLFIIYYEN